MSMPYLSTLPAMRGFVPSVAVASEPSGRPLGAVRHSPLRVCGSRTARLGTPGQYIRLSSGDSRHLCVRHPGKYLMLVENCTERRVVQLVSVPQTMGNP